MNNPYAHLRKAAGLTQKKFCEDFGFAKQTLLTAEQGIFPELSQRMTSAIYEACRVRGMDADDILTADFGMPNLEVAYLWYRNSELMEAKKNWKSPELRETDTTSPMSFLVKDTTGTIQGFSKLLKIPTATIVRYLRGLQQDMPASVREALLQVGYIYVTELAAAQAQWAINHIFGYVSAKKDD